MLEDQVVVRGNIGEGGGSLEKVTNNKLGKCTVMLSLQITRSHITGMLELVPIWVKLARNEKILGILKIIFQYTLYLCVYRRLQ